MLPRISLRYVIEKPSFTSEFADIISLCQIMELQPIELDIDDGTEVAYDQVLREIFEGYFTREGRATKHVI